MKKSTLKIIIMSGNIFTYILLTISIFMFFNIYSDIIQPDFKIKITDTYNYSYDFENKSRVSPVRIECSFHKYKIEYKRLCDKVINTYI